jgi:hypothetical protein
MWVVKLIPLDLPATGGFIFINGVERASMDRIEGGREQIMFKVGDFAKIGQVSIKTLHHYIDEME